MAEPRVRFKKEDGNSYPHWEERSLSEVCEYASVHKTGNNYIGTENLLKDFAGVDFDKERTGTGISYSKQDTLLSNIRPYLKKTWYADCDGVCSTDVLAFRPTNIKPDYLYSVISSDAFIEYVMSAAKGSKMPRGDKKHIMAYHISCPCEEEQQKIADFLSSVDEVITASEKEVANLEMQKKAVMKKIFSQEVRFKRADGSNYPEWENSTLGNLEGKVSSGKDKNEDGNVPLYGSMGPIGTCSIATVLGNKILVARVGANAGSVRLVTEDCGVTDNTLIIKDADTCNFCWLYYALVEKDIGKMRFGGGQPLVTGTMLFDLEMDVPCLEEQRFIADFLSDFDEAIAAAKKELELWKELKKGLLQQMFV